ncbi:hypothetical protein FHY12_000492 [Xanthomonas arboricola]|uniref:hypothetical protein n=1 Tax=Xanthomonas euroxanthea TaxID=2259622 RepID=UPI00141BF078|nr:hypothetical protein [Xanthomonas euroxanthea]MBB3779549.1 hypothetical protein [Xanthomonas euroxanthea]NIK38207.1 hypothetical protein [Xanthomonas euroxanthea]
MSFPKAAGSIKSPPPTVNIQRRVEVDEDGNEVEGTEEFWLIDAAGNILKGPFPSATAAAKARRAYLKQLGYSS